MVSRCTSMPTTFRFTLTRRCRQVFDGRRGHGWEFRLIPTKTQVTLYVAGFKATGRRAWHHSLVMPRVEDTARDFGVVIDSQLSLSAHVTAVCRSGHYQLRQLRQAARSLSEDASKTLVQTFVSCRLDYCNSLFFGISKGLMNRLQSV